MRKPHGCMCLWVHVQFGWFQNAYTATAINSTSFCTSARDALLILVENALRVSAINTVGDFVLFLAKVFHSFTIQTLKLWTLWTLTWMFSGARGLLHSVCWRPGSELPEGLHSVGPAPPHRITLCLLGGPLLPVCLWKCGRCSLSLLCCGHKVQWRQPWTWVLHGQSLNGERIMNMNESGLRTIYVSLSHILIKQNFVQNSHHQQLIFW